MPGADVGLTTASIVFDMRMALGVRFATLAKAGERMGHLRRPCEIKKWWANQQF